MYPLKEIDTSGILCEHQVSVIQAMSTCLSEQNTDLIKFGSQGPLNVGVHKGWCNRGGALVVTTEERREALNSLYCRINVGRVSDPAVYPWCTGSASLSSAYPWRSTHAATHCGTMHVWTRSRLLDVTAVFPRTPPCTTKIYWCSLSPHRPTVNTPNTQPPFQYSELPNRSIITHQPKTCACALQDYSAMRKT